MGKWIFFFFLLHYRCVAWCSLAAVWTNDSLQAQQRCSREVCHTHTHRPTPVDVSFYCNNMFFSSQQRQLFSSASFLTSQSRFFISSSLGEPKGWRRKQRTTQRLSLLSRQLSIIRGCERFPTNLAVLYSALQSFVSAVLNARRDPEHLQHVSNPWKKLIGRRQMSRDP